MDNVENNEVVVTFIKNGPARVEGNFKIIDKDGIELERKPRISICRCGESSKKPFCDGAHKTNGFVCE